MKYTSQVGYLNKSTDTPIKYYSSKIIIRPINFQNYLSKRSKSKFLKSNCTDFFFLAGFSHSSALIRKISADIYL